MILAYSTFRWGRLSGQIAHGPRSLQARAPRGLPRPGTGRLSGEFPDGVTSVDGVPVSATVRVHYRPDEGADGDGVLVKQVQSASDGTWVVTGLNPNLKYDVIGRRPGFNDVIVANVSPVPEDSLTIINGLGIVIS